MIRKKDGDSRTILESKSTTSFDKYFEWYQSVPQSFRSQKKIAHAEEDFDQDKDINEKYGLAWVWCLPSIQVDPDKKMQGISNLNERNASNFWNANTNFVFDGHCRFATATTDFRPIQTCKETKNACFDKDKKIHSAKGRDPSNLLQTNSNYMKSQEIQPINQNEFLQTNLSLLYERYEKKLDKESSIVCYDAKHPSLAPIMDLIHIPQHNLKIGNQSVKNNKNIFHDQMKHSHIICIHDISPSTHKPLHSFVRSDQFLQNPLLPSSLYSYFISNDLDDKVKDDGDERQKNINHIVKSLLKLPILQKAKRMTVKHKKKSNNIQQHHPHHQNKKQPRTNLKFTNMQREHDLDIKIRFIMLQLLHTVSFCHSKNITLTRAGALHPKQIFVQDDGWIRLVIPVQQIYTTLIQIEDTTLHDNSDLPYDLNLRQSHKSAESKILLTNRIQHYPGMDDSATRKWRDGTISNLTYLMLLNESAGRTIQDPCNPPILPWVTDFSRQILDLDNINETQGMGAWRDLSKSKYRITKGDVQVDHSFQNAFPSHHIPEALSEISHSVYKARCTPLHVLQTKVRPSFVPKHYPDSVEKMYQWTPDESILEFYSIDVSPNIFESRHKRLGLKDLILPKWCDGIDNFIAYHRRLLESDTVSRYLHLWIDLNFGEALVGDRAIKEKNVPLKIQSFHKIETKAHDDINPSDKTFFESCFTFVQLFRKAHPRRKLKYQSKPQNNLKHKLAPFSKADYAFNSSRLSHQYLIDEIIQSSIKKAVSEDLRHIDFISIGMVIREIYHVVDMIPSPDVKSAIYVLLTGYTGIQHLLWSHKKVNGSFTTNGVNQSISNKAFRLFPAYLQYTYFSLADAQCFENDSRVATTSSSFFSEKKMKTSSYHEIIKILQFGSDVNNLKQISFNGLGILLPKIENAILSIFSCLDEELYPFVKNIADDRHAKMAQALCKFVDSFGHYIGKKGSDQYILSPLLSCLTDASEKIDKYGKCIYTLLVSPFLPILYHRCSMEIFIRKVFPFLIQLLIRDETFCEKEQTSFSAKKATSIALISLVQEDTLQPLYTRFIVPSFIDNITDFNTFFSDVVALNKFGDPGSSDNEHPPTEIVCKSNVTESLEAIMPFLPYETLKNKICQNILKLRIPDLLNQIHNDSISTEEEKEIPDRILLVGALAQIVSVLITSIPILDPVDIFHLFFKNNNTIVHRIVHLALSNALRYKNLRQIKSSAPCISLTGTTSVSSETSHPTRKNSKYQERNLKKYQYNEVLLQNKISFFFLHQVSTLICALIRTMDLKLLPKTILPIVEAFSVTLMREYENNLGENNMMSLVDSCSSHDKSEYILSFPGIVEKNYMYDTVLDICGEKNISIYCPSLVKVSNWNRPLNEEKFEVMLDEKKSIDVSNV